MSTEPKGDQSCDDNGTKQGVRYCLRDLHTITDDKCEKCCPKKTCTVHLGAIG